MPYKDPEQRREFARRRYVERKAGDPPKPPTRKGEDTTCAFCGNAFYRKPSLKRTDNQYCSVECMTKAFVGRFVGENSPRYRGTATKSCDNCGKAVTRPHWSHNRHNLTFCDTKCFGEWKSKNWTGEDNPAWVGGHPLYYGPNWVRQSREARKRDNHQCQLCQLRESDYGRALDVHHIVPFRFFDAYKKANVLANLISLCHSCHMETEQISKDGNCKDWPSLREATLDRMELNRKV